MNNEPDLLGLYKHIVEDAIKWKHRRYREVGDYLDSLFSLPEYNHLYHAYSEALLEKPLRCPVCGGDKQLTQHHIIPQSKGGKYLDNNYCYICRDCHDIVHNMVPKVERIQEFVLEHGVYDVDYLMEEFYAEREQVIAALYPDYYVVCRGKYESRLNRRIHDGIVVLEKHLD